MPRYKNARPKAGESEFTGTMGRSTTGVPEARPDSALSASDRMRLSRISAPGDKNRRFNERIWHGETPEPTPEQAEGDWLS
jgi:hypothetical protein